MQSEIGRVQELLGTVRPPETPMQRQLGGVERELVIVNGLICGAVFGLGLLRGHGLVPTLRSAISLAVAAIPEGLPAVATTTLAVGVQDMRRRKVLVRKLDAVETLGAVEVDRPRQDRHADRKPHGDRRRSRRWRAVRARVGTADARRRRCGGRDGAQVVSAAVRGRDPVQ